MRRSPMEIVGEQNRTIGDQRRLLAKTRMCKTSVKLVRNLASFDILFFSLLTGPPPAFPLPLCLMMTN